jgi:hypothetical protein
MWRGDTGCVYRHRSLLVSGWNQLTPLGRRGGPGVADEAKLQDLIAESFQEHLFFCRLRAGSTGADTGLPTEWAAASAQFACRAGSIPVTAAQAPEEKGDARMLW